MNRMATESFYEDMVIDTPEAVANFVSFLEEEPTIAVDRSFSVKHADKECMDRLMEKYRKKD